MALPSSLLNVLQGGGLLWLSPLGSVKFMVKVLNPPEINTNSNPPKQVPVYAPELKYIGLSMCMGVSIVRAPPPPHWYFLISHRSIRKVCAPYFHLDQYAK